MERIATSYTKTLVRLIYSLKSALKYSNGIKYSKHNLKVQIEKKNIYMKETFEQCRIL